MSVKDISDFDVCRAVALYQKSLKEKPPYVNFPWPYETLAKWTGQPEKVCYRAMERADERGYLEYGVSLRTAWLTEKGEQLLKEAAPKE